MPSEPPQNPFRARALAALAQPIDRTRPVPPRIAAALTSADLTRFCIEVHGSAGGGESVRGRFDPDVLPYLRWNPHFAHGIFYGLHLDVGESLHDFRSYTGEVCPRSLQIVLSGVTWHFYADIDRFNPYEDLLNFLGHGLGEVVWPGITGAGRRLWGWIRG